MTIQDYAKQSRKLSHKTMQFLTAENIIHDPLTEQDFVILAALEKLWLKMDYLRFQVGQLSYKKRLAFLEKADLKTKWERYAFARFKNLEKGKSIRMSQLISEIELTYNFEIKPQHIKRLYRVRQKVYHLRMQEKTSSKTG